MSFCHIKLQRTFEDAKIVTYVVISPDFNETFTDEKMAQITINKSARTYDYIPCKKWLEQKTLPPTFYSNPKKIQSELLKGKYKGYSNGAWTERIYLWVSTLINKGKYPSQAPE